MKRKRLDLLRKYDVLNQNLIKIDTEENGEYYFEIASEITTDIGEAVALMMRHISWNHDIWNLSLDEIDTYNIDPEKSLYWLSGGKDEWKKRDNYKKQWIESYLLFQEEFGMVIFSIIEKSKTLKEVRDGFLREINLPILYEFALSKGIAKLD